jgi:glycosyltransferase involved in cell wall biosynthesis
MKSLNPIGRTSKNYSSSYNGSGGSGGATTAAGGISTSNSGQHSAPAVKARHSGGLGWFQIALILALFFFLQLLLSQHSPRDYHDRRRTHLGAASGEGQPTIRRFVAARSDRKRIDVACIIPLRASWFPSVLIARVLEAGVFAKVPLSVVVVATDPFTDAGMSSARQQFKSFPEFKITMLTGKEVAHGQKAAVTLVDLIKLGMEISPLSTTHFLLLSPAHNPSGPTFVADLVRAFYSTPNVGVVGCSTVMKVGSRTLIVDHGQEIGLGHLAGKERLFALRRLAGFSVNDSRYFTQEVPFVSLYCALMSRAFIEQSEMLVKLPEGGRLSDASIRGLLSVSNSSNYKTVLEVLAFRLRTLDQLMISLSIAEVTKGSAALRDAVGTSYNVDVKGIEAWEKVNHRNFREYTPGDGFNSQVRKQEEHHRDWVNSASTKAVKIFRARDLAEAALTAFMDVDRGYMLDGVATEEEVLWEAIVRTRVLGVKVLVSTASALLYSPAMSTDDLVKSILRRELLTPSVAFTTTFVDRWGPDLAVEHPMLWYLSNFSANPRLRNKFGSRMVAAASPGSPNDLEIIHPPRKIEVVWWAFCCKCCGFVNEIASLVNPLQHLHYVHLLNALDCFCPGMPLSVEDSIERLGLRIDEMPRVPNDVVVYISHTDPTMYVEYEYQSSKWDFFIGRSMYEFSRIAASHADLANKGMVNEVWVPGEFVHKVYRDSGVHPDKLFILPEAVDVFLFDPKKTGKIEMPPQGGGWKVECNYDLQNADRLDPNRFRFLSDFKWESRKGWDILLESYFEAFQRSDPVSLYILTHKHIWDPAKGHEKNNPALIRDEIEAFLKNHPALASKDRNNFPHYCLLISELTAYEVAELYNSVDAFVLPTRGEGWGLPYIQAMAMGLPTLGTGWGGNTAFMNEDNSFLIALDAVEEVPQNSEYGWQPGKKWATPSVSHLVTLMRHVVRDREHAKAVGARARKYVVDNFSEAALGRMIDERLRIIQAVVTHPKWVRDGGTVAAFLRTYQADIDRAVKEGGMRLGSRPTYEPVFLKKASSSDGEVAVRTNSSG